MGVVGLFAAVIGLDDEGVGPLGYMAGGANLGVQRTGDMLEQGVERHLQCSFGIDPLHTRTCIYITHLSGDLQECKPYIERDKIPPWGAGLGDGWWWWWWWWWSCILVDILTARPRGSAEGQLADVPGDGFCVQLVEPDARGSETVMVGVVCFGIVNTAAGRVEAEDRLLSGDGNARTGGETQHDGDGATMGGWNECTR